MPPPPNITKKGGGQSIRWPPPWDEMMKIINVASVYEIMMNKLDKKKMLNFFFLPKLKKKIFKLSETCAQFFFLKSNGKKFQVHLFRMYQDGQIDHISKTDFLFVSKHDAAFAHLRTCRAPLPLLRSGGNHMKDAECADCIYVNTLEFPSVSPTKKNVLKVTKFTGKMSNGLKRIKNPFYYFLQFLFFEILLILY